MRKAGRVDGRLEHRIASSTFMHARLLRRCLAVLLTALVGCANRASAPLPQAQHAPAWIETEDSPHDVRLLGWCTTVLSDGRVLGVGLARNNLESLSFLYDPGTQRWRAMEPVPGVFRLGDPVFSLPNGQALAFAARRSDRRTTAMLFNAANGQWQDAGTSPDTDANWGRKVVPLASSRYLMLGGKHSRAAWIYDATQKAWRPTSDVPRDVSEVQSTLPLDDGRAFVLFSDTTLLNGWIGMVYDARTDVWRVAPPPHITMRGTPDGILKLPDGSILLLGFVQLPRVSFGALIFHPESVTWEDGGRFPSGNFLEARSPTLLPSGEVLAIQNGVAFGRVRSLLFDYGRRSWRAGADLPDGYRGAAIVGARGDGAVWAVGFRSNVQRDELLYLPSERRWKSEAPLPSGSVAWTAGVGSDSAALLYLSANLSADSTVDKAVLFRP